MEKGGGVGQLELKCTECGLSEHLFNGALWCFYYTYILLIIHHLDETLWPWNCVQQMYKISWEFLKNQEKKLWKIPKVLDSTSETQPGDPKHQIPAGNFRSIFTMKNNWEQNKIKRWVGKPSHWSPSRATVGASSLPPPPPKASLLRWGLQWEGKLSVTWSPRSNF